jgi:hypothetical protein
VTVDGTPQRRQDVAAHRGTSAVLALVSRIFGSTRRGVEQQFAAILGQMFPDLGYRGIEPSQNAERIKKVAREPYELAYVDNLPSTCWAAPSSVWSASRLG